MNVMYCLLYQLSYVSMTGILSNYIQWSNNRQTTIYCGLQGHKMPVLFYVCEINLNEFIFYVNS